MTSEYLVEDPYTPGAWLVRKDGADQSWIDPLDPARLEFDYMQHAAWLIDTWAAARGIAPAHRLRAVHIGGAGMSLARWLSVTRPTSAQIVLEPDTAITQAVREIAPLPAHSGIKVRAVDGRTGLAAMPNDYADVVILDAFDHCQVPSSLVSTEFMADVWRVLSVKGLLVANLIDAHPHDWARRVVATMQRVFTTTCLVAESHGLKAHRVTNLVIGASPSSLEWDGLARRVAGAPFPCTALTDDDLTRWVAGAHPFTDADAQPSPPRQDGDLNWYG